MNLLSLLCLKISSIFQSQHLLPSIVHLEETGKKRVCVCVLNYIHQFLVLTDLVIVRLKI